MSREMVRPPVRRATASLRTPFPTRYGAGLFSGCPEFVGTPLAYAREEEIFGDGEEAESVYRVVQGAVRTLKILSDGRRQVTGFHLPGDLFGFEQAETHRHTAEALSGTRVLIFKRRQIERIAAVRAEVACQLWSLAKRSLRHAQDHMLLLGRRSAQERVAAFLLDVDARMGGTGTFDLPMPRRDIADYLGLTIETVSRTFSQLEGEGALQRSSGRQISLHHDRMHRLVED
jgi:CRP-like cAMP-binding protein